MSKFDKISLPKEIGGTVETFSRKDNMLVGHHRSVLLARAPALLLEENQGRFGILGGFKDVELHELQMVKVIKNDYFGFDEIFGYS